jgi:hypothetical protein
MKFNFSSGIASAFGRYEPALKLNSYSALFMVAIIFSSFYFQSGSHNEI